MKWKFTKIIILTLKFTSTVILSAKLINLHINLFFRTPLKVKKIFVDRRHLNFSVKIHDIYSRTHENHKLFNKHPQPKALFFIYPLIYEGWEQACGKPRVCVCDEQIQQLFERCSAKGMQLNEIPIFSLKK